MAYDNIPFLEARNLVEKRNYGQSHTIPIKTLKDYPVLPVKENNALSPRSHPQDFHEKETDASIPYKRMVLKNSKVNVSLELQNMMEFVMADSDAEDLCDRIKKTIDLHILTKSAKKKNVS